MQPPTCSSELSFPLAGELSCCSSSGLLPRHQPNALSRTSDSTAPLSPCCARRPRGGLRCASVTAETMLAKAASASKFSTSWASRPARRCA